MIVILVVSSSVGANILQYIMDNGGRVSSLSRVAADLGLDYAQAYRAVQGLEAQGVLRVRRSKPGAPMMMEISYDSAIRGSHDASL